MKKKMQITDIDIKYDPAYVRLQFNDDPFWVGIETQKILAYIAQSKGWLYDKLDNNLIIPYENNACTIISFRTYCKMYPKQYRSYIQAYVDSVYQEPELDIIDQAIKDRKNVW